MEDKAIMRMDKDPSYFFKYQRRFGKTSEPVADLKVVKNGNEIIVTDSVEKANILSDQYKSVWSDPMTSEIVYDLNEFFSGCTKCESQQTHICINDLFLEEISTKYLDQLVELELEEKNHNILTDADFSESHILKFINDISVSSSTGPDGLPGKMIKEGKIVISKMLSIIGKQSIREGCFPTRLKNMFILGFHKGGKRDLASQYRPIALTSHLAKILEKVVRISVINHLDLFNMMDPKQHGSRKGRSTLSQLLIHQAEIIDGLIEGNNVDNIYIDFSKAYDKVDHGVLLRKIKKLNIDGNLGKWIASFIRDRPQQVVVDGQKSRKEIIRSGIPQGSVLGPILFLIYIGDVCRKDGRALVYVDDVKLKGYISNEDDVNQLQFELDKLYEWGKANNCIFNELKFMCLRYGKNRKLSDNTMYFTPEMNNIIEEVLEK